MDGENEPEVTSNRSIAVGLPRHAPAGQPAEYWHAPPATRTSFVSSGTADATKRGVLIIVAAATALAAGSV